MANKLKMEFLGTFFLILVIAFTGNPMAIGGVLIALVYMGGYISGAHYNPAVTLSLWFANKIKTPQAIKYIITQMVAGIAAAFIYHLVDGSKFIPTIGPDLAAAFFVEVIFTFLLCSVILHVAATDKTKDNQYFGLAIGITLFVAATVGGPISGGAFNPAVGVSPLLYDFAKLGTNITSISIYLLGPLTGGVLAGLIYKSFQQK